MLLFAPASSKLAPPTPLVDIASKSAHCRGEAVLVGSGLTGLRPLAARLHHLLSPPFPASRPSTSLISSHWPMSAKRHAPKRPGLDRRSDAYWPVLFKPALDAIPLDQLPDRLDEVLLYGIWTMGSAVMPITHDASTSNSATYDSRDGDETADSTAGPSRPADSSERATLARLRSLAPVFYACAEAHLFAGRLRPTVSTIQSLFLLSLYSHGENGEKDGQRAAKVEPVDASLPSSDAASSEEDSKHTSASAASSDSTAAATGVVDLDAHVRQLEARIASLESEMDRRVAEVESEILRETQAKCELWRAQAEQGMELERASWERDHGRIFRKVVEQQEQQKQKKQSQASKAGSKQGAGGSGNSGADGGDNDEEEEEEQSARSASSGGTGDTDLSSNSGASAASTNATSPPSSIAESVGRFGKSLLGSTSSTSSSPSRTTKLGSGVVGRTEDGEDEDEKRALGAAGGGPGAVGPGRAGSSKPFLFSDNSAAVPAAGRGVPPRRGGHAGRLAAGGHSDRPTIVKPHFADQFLWGQQVETLGVGRCTRGELGAGKLADALVAATRDDQMPARMSSSTTDDSTSPQLLPQVFFFLINQQRRQGRRR
ncbi:Sterol 3-beta-glucosyltransferase [Tilletia horrida]|nr:Sterol 3-beta-glucosyltransferase [Tilletia horrida]